MLARIASAVTALSAFAIAIVCVTLSAAEPPDNQERSVVRTLNFEGGVSIATRILPDDRLVVVKKIQGLPPAGPSLTAEQDFERLNETAHAILLVDVKQVEGELSPLGDWVRTRIRGAVRDVVKPPVRGSIGDGNGGVEFEFDGGEARFGDTVVRVGRYPIVRPGHAYLVMFRSDPTAPVVTRWYPFQPFRVSEAGTLVEPEVFDPDGRPAVHSPLDGWPVGEAVIRLKFFGPWQAGTRCEPSVFGGVRLCQVQDGNWQHKFQLGTDVSLDVAVTLITALRDGRMLNRQAVLKSNSPAGLVGQPPDLPVVDVTRAYSIRRSRGNMGISDRIPPHQYVIQLQTRRTGLRAWSFM